MKKSSKRRASLLLGTLTAISAAFAATTVNASALSINDILNIASGRNNGCAVTSIIPYLSGNNSFDLSGLIGNNGCGSGSCGSQKPAGNDCTNGNCNTTPVCTNGSCNTTPACTNGNCNTTPACTNGNCNTTPICTDGNCGTTPDCTDGSCINENTAPTVTVTDSEVNQVLALVNKERRAAGLNELILSPQLCTAAQVRAKEIVSYFSHTRPNGSSCFTVFKETGISYKAAGENIASGQRSASEVMNGWMNSSGHRANILGKNFGKIGIACYENGGRKHWVQLFTD